MELFKVICNVDMKVTSVLSSDNMSLLRCKAHQDEWAQLGTHVLQREFYMQVTITLDALVRSS